MTPEQKQFIEKKEQEKKASHAGDFDLRNRITNAEGEVEHKQDYFIYIVGGERYFERPIGSGNLFYANGDQAGRVTKSEGKPVFDKEAKHEDFASPLSEDAAATEKLKVNQAELEAMRKELAAIKAEKDQAEKAQKLTSEAKVKAGAGKEKEN